MGISAHIVIYVNVWGQESVPQIKMSAKYFESKSRELILFIILKYFWCSSLSTVDGTWIAEILSLDSCRSILN